METAFFKWYTKFPNNITKNNFTYWLKKTDADIWKAIISWCMDFFGLYLPCTLVAVLLLTDGSTYWLVKVMEMLLTVTKRSKFFWNCWVNPFLTFNGNRMQYKYICWPHKFQQIANQSYAFSYEKLFKHDTRGKQQQDVLFSLIIMNFN
jgi:hypothetical protein